MKSELTKSSPAFFKNHAKYFSFETIILATALVTLASAAIFIKLSLGLMSPNATIFHRLWIATLALWAIESLVGSKKNIPEKNPRNSQEEKKKIWLTSKPVLISIVAITSTASLLCWAWSLTQTSVANSTLLRNLTPLFTSFVSWLLFRMPIERRFAAGMGVALVGVVAIGWDDLQVGTESIYGDGLALLSAILYGIYLMAVEQLRVSLSSTQILLWRCGIGTLIMLPFMWNETSFFPDSKEGWLIVAALAIICQLLGQGLLIFCLKKFSANLIAIFLLLQPAIASVFAWLIFEEGLSLENGVAFLLVMLGVYLAQSENSSDNKEITR